MKALGYATSGDKQFGQHAGLGQLEDQLVEHVRAAIDFQRLAGFEQHAFELLVRDEELPEPLALDLSQLLVRQALEAVIRHPMHATSVPFGVSKAEQFAAAFEDDCPFCALEAEVRARAVEQGRNPDRPYDDDDGDDNDGDDDDHDDDCPCCAMLVAEWRAENADALRRFGLAAGERTGDPRGPQ